MVDRLRRAFAATQRTEKASTAKTVRALLWRGVCRHVLGNIIACLHTAAAAAAFADGPFPEDVCTSQQAVNLSRNVS